MDFLSLLLHIDEHLAGAIALLGPWSYVILFLVIFAETGLVVIPFLPGDSLLFAAGALAGSGLLNLAILIPSLLVAAIVGDSLNYAIGRRIGTRVFARENSKLFKPAYLQQTQAFYAAHGGKTIILARFLPIVRTFAPFVAGIGHMRYRVFFIYNVVGAVLWVLSMTLAGYFFGSIPIIKNNFEYVVIGIIAASLIPPIIEYLRHRSKPKAAPEATSYEQLTDTFKKGDLTDGQ